MEKKGFPFKKCYCTLYKSLQSDIRSGRRGFPKFTKFLWNEVWIIIRASLVARMLKNLPAMQETQVGSLDWEDPVKKGMANPLQYSCLENSMGRGTWWTTVLGVTKSWTGLSD